MSNNKQSSVEWLVCELIDKEYKNANDTALISIIEQAKAMHKEESQKIFECGRNFQLTGEGTFEEIYNEQFNQQQTT